jgi:hypothetical protein
MPGTVSPFLIFVGSNRIDAVEQSESFAKAVRASGNEATVTARRHALSPHGPSGPQGLSLGLQHLHLPRQLLFRDHHGRGAAMWNPKWALDDRLGLPVANALTGFSNHQLSVPARFNRFGAAVAAVDRAQTKGTDDKPIAIADWGYGWRNGIFWLFQEKDKLLVGLSKTWGDNKPEVFEMATLPDTKPHHVIVSIADKRLAFHQPEAAQNAAAVAASLTRRKTPPQIDLQPTAMASQKPVASVKLVLERFSDHDELASELISDTLEENFDLDLHTDVNL